MKLISPLLAAAWLFAGPGEAPAADASPAAHPTLTLDLAKPGTAVSPRLYGLMTEEINHSYDGGLYGELIQNRIFKDDAKMPAHWSFMQEGGGNGSIALDNGQPVNDALTVCLKLDVTAPGTRAGVANDGFWGIPVKPGTTYRASFYAKAAGEAGAPLKVSIESPDGGTVYAEGRVENISGAWKQYHLTLTTSKEVKPTAAARFVISTTRPGTLWLNLVSLFPPTYNNRPNGNRPDIMELLGAMKPRFLRCPGGNYVEGDAFQSRFNWKQTIGPLDQRPGHPGCWRYRSSDGMGLLEFMEWCDDLKMEPVLAVFAGYVLKGDYIEHGTALQGFVDEALQEIEYVTGDTDTKWGAERAKDGHPEPFKLTYVEIGNEDMFDKSGSYDGRFTQFYDAIKAKYPSLQVIATTRVKSRTPDVLDDHYYRSAAAMEGDATHYDRYNRAGPKIFVGEWATRTGSWPAPKNAPTPDLGKALGDAAWLTGLERNSDLVVMQCYAPLFINVNPGASQWQPDLIGYDALASYGSVSYYAQKIFSENLGDKVVPISAMDVPQSAGQNFPALFYVATRDSKSGMVYLKIVNVDATPQPVQIELDGAGNVSSDGVSIVLASDKPGDTNSITVPEKVIPVTSKITGLGKKFDRTLPPYSITVLQIRTH